MNPRRSASCSRHAAIRCSTGGDVCDIYVINTCTVTAESDRKSRQIIRRARKNNPDGIVMVMGCYSQRDPEAVANIEGVSAVIGTQDKMKCVEIAERMLNSECRMQNAVSSNKTVDNCFLRSECAETRSNASEACPHEQNDYVSRENDDDAEKRD